jgi:hypothetical protein
MWHFLVGDECVDAFTSVLLTKKEKEGDVGELKNLKFRLANPSTQPMLRILTSVLFTLSESNLKYLVTFLEKKSLKLLLTLGRRPPDRKANGEAGDSPTELNLTQTI